MNAGESIGTDFVPPDVRLMMERIGQSGSEVWLVGGAVRDRLMGQAPKDWDLATSLPPEQVMRLFPRVLPVGIRHGTVRIHTRLRDVEVTSYPGARLEGILADLARRDFTINALALSYPEGALLDPHDGRADLDGRLLRAVGDANARFGEDPLRVLRAFRFVSELGFRIHEDTYVAVVPGAAGLLTVAGERIREELFRILLGGHASESLSLMRDTGTLRTILPELDDGAALHTIPAIGECPPRLGVRIAAMLHGVGTGGCTGSPSGTLNLKGAVLLAEQAMERWKMSNRQIREVKTILCNPLPDEADEWSDPEVREFMVRAGADFVDDIVDLAVACGASEPGQGLPAGKGRILHRRFREQRERHFALGLGDLAVDGEDVIRLTGLERGPIVGEILRRLHRKVLEDPVLNDRKILMDFIRKEYHIEAMRETL